MPNSSSYTQSEVPLIIFSEPSEVTCQLCPVREILDGDVVEAHIGDFAAIRRELGKHQTGRRSTGGDLTKASGFAVEHPVVTTGIGAPHSLRVGEDQQPIQVGRPRVVLDLERLLCRRKVSIVGRTPSTSPFSGGRVVADDLLDFGGRRGRLHVA